MAVRLGDTAPDFTADSTAGEIRFHDWLGDSWGVLFSHPKDFTPVCTTELGSLAQLEPEFTKRNAKLIGLSVDPVDNHSRWVADIEETQGAKVTYPMIGDTDLAVAKLYNMLPADEAGTAAFAQPRRRDPHARSQGCRPGAGRRPGGCATCCRCRRTRRAPPASRPPSART